ncbi:MAG: type IV pilus modification PilV family protein [Acidobacteriota bacterium]
MAERTPLQERPGATVRSGGFTLVELMVIIVVLGIAAATLTTASVRSAEMSASMLVEQQALMVANSMLDEVRAMPFTYCDLNSANVGTAANQGACAIPEPLFPVLGPEPGESRLGALLRFDHVTDYNGLVIPANTLRDASGNLVTLNLPAVANCAIRVLVAPQAIASVPPIPNTEAVRITVIVGCPGQLNPVTVDAVRIRYAPNRR